MYIVFGNKIVDSNDFKTIIESNSHFKVVKDMSKGSKRDDVIAFNISISVDILKEILEDDFSLADLSEDEVFDELMTLSEELGTDLEEFMPEDSIINVESYKWDISDNDIKSILIIVHDDFSQGKLKDISKRLKTQVE